MATVEGLNIRGSRYYLRVVIPRDLQEVFGKTRLNLQLGTSDRLEAVRKGHRLRAEWLDQFEAKRKTLNPSRLETITPSMSKALAGAARRRVLQEDENRRHGKDPYFKALLELSTRGHAYMRDPDGSIFSLNKDPFGGLRPPEVRGLKALNNAMNEDARDNYARMNLSSVLPLLQKDAKAMGFLVDEKSQGLQEALSAYLAAYREAWKGTLARDSGEVVETPPVQTTPEAHPQPLQKADSSPKKTLMEVYHLWLKIKARTKSSEQACKLAIEQCEQCLGKPLHIQSIVRSQGDAFRAWLLDRERGISPKTARDRLTAIKSLLVYACRDLELIPKQPWEGLDIRVKKTVTRRAWRDEELQLLFSQPLFQAYETPKGRNAGSDAAYWIPLLGLYTGARIGELAQLRASDITEEDGTPVLNRPGFRGGCLV